MDIVGMLKLTNAGATRAERDRGDDHQGASNGQGALQHPEANVHRLSAAPTVRKAVTLNSFAVRSCLMVCLCLVAGNGCGPEGTNGGDGGDRAAGLTVVDTGTVAHIESPVRVGDRLIAVRSDQSGELVNRAYDVQTDTTYDIVSEETDFGPDFVVSGTSVVLRGAQAGVYHFNNADAETVTHVSPGVRLNDAVFGELVTDGGDIVAFVSTEPFICWVDLRDQPLSIRTFGRFPENENFYHASVSGSQIAFFDGSTKVEVRDTAGLEPAQEFEVDADVEEPLDFKDGVIVYEDAATDQVMVVDVEADTITSTGIRNASRFRTRGGTLCMFNAEDADGDTFASAVGQSGTDLAVAPDLNLGSRVSPGWGLTCAVTFDGSMVFTAGADDPTDSQSDVLSVWVQGNIADAFDGEFAASLESDPMLVTASNVSAGDGLVGMLLHTGQSQEAHIGYIKLD